MGNGCSSGTVTSFAGDLCSLLHAQVKEKDWVIMLNGRMKERGGSVAFIWRGTLFLHCKDVTENGGYVAVSGRQGCSKQRMRNLKMHMRFRDTCKRRS